MNLNYLLSIQWTTRIFIRNDKENNNNNNSNNSSSRSSKQNINDHL